MKSVYSAVRTGSLNKAVWASALKGYIQGQPHFNIQLPTCEKAQFLKLVHNPTFSYAGTDPTPIKSFYQQFVFPDSEEEAINNINLFFEKFETNSLTEKMHTLKELKPDLFVNY